MPGIAPINMNSPARQNHVCHVIAKRPNDREMTKGNSHSRCGAGVSKACEIARRSALGHWRVTAGDVTIWVSVRLGSVTGAGERSAGASRSGEKSREASRVVRERRTEVGWGDGGTEQSVVSHGCRLSGIKRFWESGINNARKKCIRLGIIRNHFVLATLYF